MMLEKVVILSKQLRSFIKYLKDYESKKIRNKIIIEITCNF